MDVASSRSSRRSTVLNTVSSPLVVVPFAEHDSNDYVKRPRPVASILEGGVTVEIREQRRVIGSQGKSKLVGYLLMSAGRSVQGFFPSEKAARESVSEFIKAMTTTTLLWGLTFLIIVSIFPEVA